MKENFRNNNYTNDNIKINLVTSNIYEAIKMKIDEWHEQNRKQLS